MFIPEVQCEVRGLMNAAVGVLTNAAVGVLTNAAVGGTNVQEVNFYPFMVRLCNASF